ncbi:Gfo/Idh/MocA family protein [Paenibacillus nasutitermitis]|uniref:1-carboxy-3-chloro-3,4-dihydroxycyclo hexa-1,5-diene dehydrogenase n=1 Tax=Paenibacillus nasutitermitis TaxID=1652958 RepID=A0A916YTM0_9BACL|nr:Gfo/Idh/MocA family oxidoreductase [Paenibacillus nasutitermitis]GGD59726.1 1-carboxy-3-chloro-3,4-dihydroxycyclo hexa-1,5-diene dehydrogenase [Paenibacillus nasutitermitis]
MNENIRIGLIGASWFADLWFLPVLTRHPHVTVAAICSKNGESARQMAAKYGIAAAYTSAEEMMDAERLDGICIITPNDLHHPIVMEALQRGLHVLCEKPLAIDSDESGEMLRKAQEKGVVHSVNFSVREHPGIRYLKKAVSDGRIGCFLEGRFEYSGDYGLSGPPGWRGSVRSGGAGGVLQDLGSHIIDLAQHVLDDRIVAVSASMSCLESGRPVRFVERTNPDQAADSVYVQAEFGRGGHGVFQTSWIRPQGKGGQTITLELFGTEGALQLTATGYGYKMMCARKDETWQEVVLPEALPWDLSAQPSEDRFRPYRDSERNEAWKWADAVIAVKSTGSTDRSRLPGFEDADRVQRVIDAVVLSDQSGRQEAVTE